jgi:hypothetical protein
LDSDFTLTEQSGEVISSSKGYHFAINLIIAPAQFVRSVCSGKARMIHFNSDVYIRFIPHIYNNGKLDSLTEYVATRFVEHQKGVYPPTIEGFTTWNAIIFSRLCHLPKGAKKSNMAMIKPVIKKFVGVTIFSDKPE